MAAACGSASPSIPPDASPVVHEVERPGGQVKIYIDGRLKVTGTTWKDYYRYDAERAGNGNKVATARKLLLRESALRIS